MELLHLLADLSPDPSVPANHLLVRDSKMNGFVANTEGELKWKLRNVRGRRTDLNI